MTTALSRVTKSIDIYYKACCMVLTQKNTCKLDLEQRLQRLIDNVEGVFDGAGARTNTSRLGCPTQGRLDVGTLQLIYLVQLCPLFGHRGEPTITS